MSKHWKQSLRADEPVTTMTREYLCVVLLFFKNIFLCLVTKKTQKNCFFLVILQGNSLRRGLQATERRTSHTKTIIVKILWLKSSWSFRLKMRRSKKGSRPVMSKLWWNKRSWTSDVIRKTHNFQILYKLLYIYIYISF